MNSMRLCHANSNGTGAAMKLTLVPAAEHESGGVSIEMSPQSTRSSFDWLRAIAARLYPVDVAELVMVFRGMQESIADGNGIFRRTMSSVTIVKLEHKIEPVSGYWLEVRRKPLDEDVAQTVGIFLSQAEALVLCSALEQAMAYMVFGLPAKEA